MHMARRMVSKTVKRRLDLHSWHLSFKPIIFFAFITFNRCWSLSTHLEWRCSKTQPYQTTCRRRRRAQRERLTVQFPAPQLKRTPMAAGSTLLPVSSQKPSTGETGALWFSETQCHRRATYCSLLLSMLLEWTRLEVRTLQDCVLASYARAEPQISTCLKALQI